MQLDQQKSGQVKMEAFETVLGLHNVRVSKESLNTLARECKPKGVINGQNDSLVYREALQRLSINMEVDEPMMKEWIVRTAQREFSPVPSSFSLRSSVHGSMSTNKMLK